MKLLLGAIFFFGIGLVAMWHFLSACRTGRVLVPRRLIGSGYEVSDRIQAALGFTWVAKKDGPARFWILAAVQLVAGLVCFVLAAASAYAYYLPPPSV